MTVPVRTTLRLRVTVADTWAVCPLEARKNESVGEVKLRALASAHIDPARAGGYAVKFAGALVRDEASLADARVPDGGALIVLAARRRAAR